MTPVRPPRFGDIRRATTLISARRAKSGLVEFLSHILGVMGQFALKAARALGLTWLFRHLRQLTMEAISAAFRFGRRRRSQVKPFATTASDVVMLFQHSASTNRTLRATLWLFEHNCPVIPQMLFAFFRYGLVLGAGVHLGAGQTSRALVTARVMNLMFRSQVRNLHRPFAPIYFQILYHAHLLDRIARETLQTRPSDDFYLNRIFGNAHLNRGDGTTARRFLTRAIELHDESYLEHRMLGRSFLIEGRNAEAADSFQRSVELLPSTVMAHQNYSGRYDTTSYAPKLWELREAGKLLIYDNLGQFAEDQFLRGNLEMSFTYYQKMLKYQDDISKDRKLPRKVGFPLWLEFEQFDPDLPIRLMPYEWVTQFGHIGLFDSVLKMRQLGMLPHANYVVLAPANKTVNDEYLSYWEKEFCVVRDPVLVDELFPYQRFFGENFMAYRSAGEAAEPWTLAAARAQCAWAESNRGPLLSLTEEDHRYGIARLRELGVDRDAWYVGLHVREGGYYSEAAGGMSDHRNSKIEDYFSAIHEITSQGGTVIRLGDPSMRSMPALPGVVDYTRSPVRSRRMDLFLLATSRFVIGTTSGLTTVTLSFGTPMLLVNCISNDWQLWTEGVDFTVKKIYSRHQRRYLSLAETYRPPLQGYLINQMVLDRHGYEAHSNSPDEILAAVRYKLNVLEGTRPRGNERDAVMLRYRRSIGNNPYIFGAARPVSTFLEMNPDLLLNDDCENTKPDNSLRRSLTRVENGTRPKTVISA